jgi:hypothetical protein
MFASVSGERQSKRFFDCGFAFAQNDNHEII